jgi:arabinose-5-phosphate isomerase
MHGDLGMTGPKDVLLALSFSGESEEVIRLIPAIRRHGLKVVALTGRTDSTLAGLSDVVLEIPCGPEACPFGMAPTNSTTATMAMGDALAMVMIDARQFDKESYALNHPAGAIGRALVMRVSDVMRVGDRCALVSPETTVLDTLLAMTKAQGGSAVVVNPDGTLAGIFTDGDFRRGFAAAAPSAASALLAAPVADHMTRHPLFVRDTAYAVDLLRIFERKRVDDLPVCDDAGRVVGLVNIQDLPKVKVL